MKQPSVSDLPSSYRVNVPDSQPRNNIKVAATYLETHELLELADKMTDIKKVAAGIDFKLKVQLELGGESQPSDEVIAQINQMLQEISNGFKLQ